MTISSWTSVWTAISPLVAAWLLTFAMHSTLLMSSVWLVTRYVRAYRLQDALWKMALVGGLLTATLQVPGNVHPFSRPIELPRGSASQPQIATQGSPAFQAWVEAEAALDASGSPQVSVGHGQTAIAPVASPATPSLNSLAGWLLGLWLAGAVASGLRFGLARRRFHASLRSRRDVPPGPLTDMLDQLCHMAGLRHRVRLTYSTEISSPVALNHREICLPQQAITQLSAEQQEGLLAHEVAHVARHDPFWLALSGLFGSLFFFQPLYRLARRRIQACAEYLCDDQAARHTGGGLALAKCLAEVVRWPRTHTPQVVVANMTGNTSSLERRVRRLLDDVWATRIETPRWWWACLVIGALVVVGCAGPGVSVQTEDAAPVVSGLEERVADEAHASEDEMEQGGATSVAGGVEEYATEEAPTGGVDTGQDGVTSTVHGAPDALAWPVEGHVTQPYSAQHPALDIAAEAGTPVLAAADGVVVAADWSDEGYGNVVAIDHGDGLRALYSHLLDYQVAVGDEVVAGQQIGSVGSTGKSTGPHLHFELRQFVNPLSLLESVDTGPGAFVWPVEGEITQGYSAQHHALDIAAEAGTPVVAADAGVVVAAQWNSEGYGNIVLIDHGGELRALYSHLQDYQVQAGDKVTAGQQIGTVGSTGKSTGPHLHFELRQHLDPLPLLQD